MTGHTRSEVEKRLAAIATMKAEIEWLLKDQKVVITSNYNGQPFGTSKPPLTGKTVTIKRISLSEWMGPKVHLFVDDQRCSLDMDEVRLPDED